ncbi:MAG: DNA-directed RNA polymerase subunit omega [Clostridia bacterium]|nr:DNA-directed RNA polymerase subunit omega [Clostridia bacterium]
MIHKPPIDELADKMGSKYVLCVVTSKRARQLLEHAQSQGYKELPNKEKPLSIVAQEIYDSKLIATND